MKIYKITAMEQLKELWNMLTSDRDKKIFNGSYFYDYCTNYSRRNFNIAEAIYIAMLRRDGVFYIDSLNGTYIDQDNWRNNENIYEVNSVCTGRYSL